MHVSTEAHGNRAQTDNHNSLADAADPAESPVRSRRDHPPRRGRRMPGTTAPARTPPRAAAGPHEKGLRRQARICFPPRSRPKDGFPASADRLPLRPPPLPG